jgi:superfamily II DNA/RNA helicase
VQSTFPDLGVSADVTSALAERGITEAFPIQAATIVDALAGRDVCGKAPTGSGKTLAFGIPLAMRVGRGKPNRPKALILAPTRELAAQIHAELAPLLRLHGRRVASFYGGVSIVPQLKALNRSVDVVVACPGRLGDLVARGACKLNDIELVVVDEADRMADMGFLPDVRRILDAVRPDRQTLLFSATLDGDVDVLIKRYQRDPARHDVTPPEREDRTTHLFVDTRREDRTDMVRDLVVEHGSTVVFCRTKHGADRLAKQLGKAGVVAVPIHGNRSQSQRDRALADFAAGRAKAHIATDVAARGIHVDDVGCVVHFDVPADPKDYLHRSGRTGRAGAAGTVVSLVTGEDGKAVRDIKRALGMAAGEEPRREATRRPQRSAGAQRPANGQRSAGGHRVGNAPRPANGQRRRRNPRGRAA